MTIAEALAWFVGACIAALPFLIAARLSERRVSDLPSVALRASSRIVGLHAGQQIAEEMGGPPSEAVERIRAARAEAEERAAVATQKMLDARRAETTSSVAGAIALFQAIRIDPIDSLPSPSPSPSKKGKVRRA